MSYNVNHIHLKSEDPKSTADWFVKAFNVEIISDTVRHFGDRFIVTKSENDITINISGNDPKGLLAIIRKDIKKIHFLYECQEDVDFLSKEGAPNAASICWRV